MTKRHNIWSHFRLAVLLAVLVLALCGCSSDDVRLPERVDLFRGQQFALASAVEIEGDPDAADVLAALAAADAHGVTVDFASADESVATVDELGIVQGVAPGETTVTVTCAAFGYTARVQVAVLEPAAALTVAPQLTLEPGQTASLAAAVENADPAGLVYTVSDETVAAVDEAGNVTALAQGRADITVSLPGSSLTAVCRLTVGTPVESIQLSRPEASLTAGQTLTLAAATAPAQDAAVTWQTSAPAVATVENGVVTAHGAGAAVITAAADGCTAECVLTVTAPAAATPESATPESAATAETALPATAETAAPESATPESAAPATPETGATAETAGIPATPESAATAETAGSPATPETATGETALPATAESAAAETALPRRQTSSGTATAGVRRHPGDSPACHSGERHRRNRRARHGGVCHHRERRHAGGRRLRRGRWRLPRPAGGACAGQRRLFGLAVRPVGPPVWRLNRRRGPAGPHTCQKSAVSFSKNC